MHVFVPLQDRPPGGTAKPSQVLAAPHMAMVETVAEGEANAQRHTHRRRDEGTYKTRSETNLFIACSIIIIFRSVTKISNLPSSQPHPQF
jgi:hypothetical protein